MKRRSFLAAGASMAGSAVLPRVADAAPAPRTYVLVPTAHFGGWFFEPVAQRLRGLGHRVFTPTPTGVGDRRHLLTRDITLETFITDVQNVFEFEELRDVILVGHGSGAATVSGVVDRIPELVRHVVFLDGMLVARGQTLFDVLPPIVRGQSEHAAILATDGVAFPPPENFDDLGVSRGPVADWLTRHTTPHPLGSFESPLVLAHPVGNHRPVTYVSFTSPPLPTIDGSRRLARTQTGWTWAEIGVGHAAPVVAPDEVTRLLAGIR